MTLAIPDINLNTPKRKLIALGIVLLALLFGFAFGKFNSKPNVVVEQHTQTDTKTTTDDKTRTDTTDQKANNLQEATNVNVNQVEDIDTTTTTTTDKKPTGEVVQTTTTETKKHIDDSAAAKKTTQDTSTDKEAQRVVSDEKTKTDTSTKTDFKETVTQSQPKWMIGAFGGLDTSGLGLNGNALVTGPLLYGVEGGYRFLGPLWIDTKVMKTGAGFAAAAGLQLQF